MEKENYFVLEEVRNYVEANMQNRNYHNYAHATEVAQTARRIGILEKVSPHKLYLLETAGYVHDLEKDEEQTALSIYPVLAERGYSDADIKIVQCMVRATKIPTNPKNLLEQILCDADLDNLGREDFLERNNALRRELDAESNAQWYYQTLKFLQNHKYYTASANKLRQAGLEKNIAKIKEIINNFPR